MSSARNLLELNEHVTRFEASVLLETGNQFVKVDIPYEYNMMLVNVDCILIDT